MTILLEVSRWPLLCCGLEGVATMGANKADVEIGYFSEAARRREKPEARDRDERLIASGEVNAEEIARRNGLFSTLDFSRARIVRRRVPIVSK